MSKREEKLRLVDMLETAESVMRHMEGVDVAAFIADENLRDAVIYRLQVIGEAAYQISEAFKDRNPEVEWYKIQGCATRSSTITTRLMMRPFITSPWIMCRLWRNN